MNSGWRKVDRGALKEVEDSGDRALTYRFRVCLSERKAEWVREGEKFMGVKSALAAEDEPGVN